MPRTSIGVTVADWEKLTPPSPGDSGDAPELRILHERLQAFLRL